jgi:pseudouridylate synthase
MELKIADEVAAAISDGRPVVALESTVIAHGLPYPQNLETARRCESMVRSQGAVPATIAILDGVPSVGLSAEQLEFLSTAKHIRKASKRDLAIATAKGLTFATTVSATAHIAGKAGISVFATGGIGGVHRGYTADVSADLPELASTRMTVVCSGAKIVLDLPATREWLETFGIAVIGWQCDEMPAFYSRSSGLAIDERVENAEEAARVIRARDAWGLDCSVLIAVPAPSDAEIDRGELESMLADCLREADGKAIHGKDVTPFLLSELSVRSGGRTLAANIALLENNSRVAAEISAALCKTT